MPRREPGIATRGLRCRQFFLERSDNVVARRTRCLRNFSAFFLLDVWPSKTGCLRDICVIGGYTWDRVRGCVFQWIHTFPNIKRNSVFNQEISRNLIFISRYQETRDRGKKRENEWVRQRERRREKERKRESVCVGLHIIITHVHVRVTVDCCARHICRTTPRRQPKIKPPCPALFLVSTVSALHRNAHIWNASHPLLVTYYCRVTVYSPGMEAKKIDDRNLCVISGMRTPYTLDQDSCN